ncbi:hypothetical protein ACFY30_22845 [Streptomyces sp. NPDC000345]|uniref:hypothetical protein n=1 Tax=Streptomyces sp. NPDC000345 TaxID=3364537 RepID=UPI0036998010
MKANRLRPVVIALAAVTLTAVLTGCEKGGSAAGSASGSTAGSAAGSAAGAGAGASAKPAASTAAATPAEATPSAVPSAAKKPSAAPPASSAATAAGCSDEPPTPDEVDPDELALFRIEEIDGITDKVNLVIQHGVWGCPGKDTDGAPFVVTGEDSRWAMDQAAYVTAVTPITDSTENQRIGVQELIDWVDAHPDSGLVFRYETGDDGAIHRLEQVFTP